MGDRIAGFLNKKPWHPSSFRNQEKTWLAEQRAEKEEAALRERIAEIKKEKEEEESRSGGGWVAAADNPVKKAPTTAPKRSGAADLLARARPAGGLTSVVAPTSWAAPRRARRAGIHGAARWGCFAFLHGGRTRSPIVPAWFYGPSRKQFTAFGSAGRSGWNGRKAMPFCKGWAPPALELRAGAPAATRSRVASGTRRRPGGPLSQKPLQTRTGLDTSSSFAQVAAFPGPKA